MKAKFLKKVADVLDALADQTDKQASELREIKMADRRSKVEPILDKLSSLTGESREELEDKLASADENLLSMIKKLAVDSEAPQLGGPDSTKTANYAGNADSNFADWILS